MNDVLRSLLRACVGGRAVAALLLLQLLPLACGDAAATSPGAPAEPVLPAGQVRAVVDTYVRAFATRDRELYVSLFADRGTVEDPIGSTPVVGRAALAAFFDAATAAGPLELELAPDAVRVSGNHVAFSFTLHLDGGPTPLVLPVIDTFALDRDGRILAMRAYWSPAEFRPAT
ncbi:MAG: hypothetical protein FJ148_18535 [Deltaproteobacteria bacterium]|nr:hypothetical protein [Deltaproteobacteria bacterium]